MPAENVFAAAMTGLPAVTVATTLPGAFVPAKTASGEGPEAMVTPPTTRPEVESKYEIEAT
jgi:hypothetical protein